MTARQHQQRQRRRFAIDGPLRGNRNLGDTRRPRTADNDALRFFAQSGPAWSARNVVLLLLVTPTARRM